MSKRTAKQQKYLKNLVKRCRIFVRKNGRDCYAPGGYLGWSVNGYSNTGKEYKGRSLVIRCVNIHSMGDVCSEITLYTVQKDGALRIELLAKEKLRSEPEDIKVSTYHHGDWEKKIPKQARA